MSKPADPGKPADKPPVDPQLDEHGRPISTESGGDGPPPPPPPPGSGGGGS